MKCIFPPSGEQDRERFSSVTTEDKDYMWFSLEFCDRILARRPHHMEALELAANHCTELGYFSDGLKLDRRLAALKPDDPGVLYNLSCSLTLLGHHEEALAHLARAVEKGYHDHRHMSNDRDLKALKSDPRFNELIALAAKHNAGTSKTQ